MALVIWPGEGMLRERTNCVLWIQWNGLSLGELEGSDGGIIAWPRGFNRKLLRWSLEGDWRCLYGCGGCFRRGLAGCFLGDA